MDNDSDASDEELKRLMTESPNEGPTGTGGGGGGGPKQDGSKPPTAKSSTTSLRQNNSKVSGKPPESVRSASKEKGIFDIYIYPWCTLL